MAGERSTAEAERAIRELLEQRGPGKTICPSDAARRLGGDESFHELMPLVREVAGAMVRRGGLEVTQGGKVVDLDAARGAIRLRLR